MLSSVNRISNSQVISYYSRGSFLTISILYHVTVPTDTPRDKQASDAGLPLINKKNKMNNVFHSIHWSYMEGDQVDGMRSNLDGTCNSLKR